MHGILLAVAVLAACAVDNSLTPDDKEPAGFDSGSPDTGRDTATDTLPVEACNGVDDDGDGAVDEGFPDDDGNGRVDCLDTTCPALDVGVGGAIPPVEECLREGAGVEVADPWAVRRQWTAVAPSTDPGARYVASAAVVGNLDDDNGDGHVDAEDSPEVVALFWGIGDATTVVAFDGATGAERWTWPDAHRKGIALVADVTGDDRPDVVTNNRSGFTVALDGDGNVEWTATELAASMGYFMVTTADLDQDGTVEVISDNLVLDGATGALEWSLPPSGAQCPYVHATVGDFDASGDDQEVLFCGILYDSDGTLLWDSGERGIYGMWSAPVQADADPQAELMMVGEHLSVWQDDGTILFGTGYSSIQHPGPPCVADFDGDGASEFGFANYQSFYLYELDGSLAWEAPVNDFSGLAGCSGFDVDGDGASEVLYGDHTSFWILDGATGAARYQDTDHTSGTVFEYPAVADVDRDGHAEIVVTNFDGSSAGLVVYEHDGAGWPASGTTWAAHDFAVTNIDRDGHVPRAPETCWETYGVYRARPAEDAPELADLTVDISDVCVSDCVYGPVAIAVQVANQGVADVAAGAVLTLYAEEEDGSRPITSTALPAIPAGTALDGVEVELTPTDVGRWGFSAAVDDDGSGYSAVDECDESNNRNTWSDSFCP